MSVKSLLRNQSFVWLWSGQTISVLGSHISALAFPVLAITLLGASELEMGFLNAAETSAFLLVALPAGAWVDRWLKRRVMIIADLIRLLAVASIPALWFSGSLEIWHLYITGAVIGIATVFFDVGYQSYLPILLPAKAIGPANSALEATNQISTLAGPSAVGFLLSLVKAPVLLIFDALSFLVSAISLSFVKDEEVPAAKADRQSLYKEIAEGVRFVWRQKLIRSIAFTTATNNFFSTMIFTLLPLLILRDLEISPATYGLMISFASIGGLLGAVTTPKLVKWFGEGAVIAVTAVLSGAIFFALPSAALVPTEWAPAVIAVAEGFSGVLVLAYNITQVTARQRLCPPKLLGRMNASIRAFIWGVMPIGALIGGWLGHTIGVLPTMWFACFGTLASAIFVVISPLAKMRELPSTPTD